MREGTDETHDDHDPGHEYSAQDVRDREAAIEQHLQHEEREGDEPLDVADILHRRQYEIVEGTLEVRRLLTQIWRVGS